MSNWIVYLLVALLLLVAARMLLLPLKSDLGDVTRAMGAIVTDGAIGRNPRRMVIEGHTHRTLVGYGEPLDSIIAAPKADEGVYIASNSAPLRLNEIGWKVG